ncbi:MAG: hypothetical protein JKP95_03465 [Oceanicaulis sp.]|nr:hypothetical protein [Oceanicaulis sp.]
MIAVSRDTLDTTTRSNPVAERKTMRAVAGLRGFIPEFGFDYELSYSYAAPMRTSPRACVSKTASLRPSTP